MLQKDNMKGRLMNMARLEYWNISWLVAQAFTWGSVVWVINGFAAFLPFVDSSVAKNTVSTGWTAFLGATIFELGSLFGVWEAWNADNKAFEWEMKHVAEEVQTDIERGRRSTQTNSSEDVDPQTQELHTNPKSRPKWIWFSTDSKYWHELAWYGAFFQMCGASVFWISGFTAIPTIQDAIKPHTGVLDGIFWVPQVVGGMGFVISATFIMLNSQQVWWRPRLLIGRWHVGFWNFLGGVGFTLSGIFGFYTSSRAEYQSALSTFWGGWAFLIGSLVQWYESVN